MEKRESGIDLVRIVGLFFVTGIHFFLYNGYYYEKQVGFAIFAADCAKWLFFSCNAIFMLLTGYLHWNRDGQGKGILSVIVSYLVVCAVSIPVRIFYLHEHFTFWEWAEKIFSFSAAYYGWYIGMHIGLLLISPLLNTAIRHADDRQLLRITAGLFLATTAGSISDLTFFPTWWAGAYPLTCYLLGACISRLKPKIFPWICFGICAFTSILMGLLTVLPTDNTYSEGFSQGYGGFYITIMALSLFLGLYRLEVRGRAARLLRWLSGAFPEGYLVSHLLDSWVYRLRPDWHTPEKYPIAFLCMTVPIFLTSAIAGRLLHYISAYLTKRLLQLKVRR